MIVVSTHALLFTTAEPDAHVRRFVALLKRQLAPPGAGGGEEECGSRGEGQTPAWTPSGGARRTQSEPAPETLTRPPTRSPSKPTPFAPVPAPPPPPSRTSTPPPLSRMYSLESGMDDILDAAKCAEYDAAAAAAADYDLDDSRTFPTTDILGLKHDIAHDLRVLDLPFELRVIEAALHDVCQRLLDETTTLERDASPALERLADHVTRRSLERVRSVKARPPHTGPHTTPSAW